MRTAARRVNAPESADHGGDESEKSQYVDESPRATMPDKEQPRPQRVDTKLHNKKNKR